MIQLPKGVHNYRFAIAMSVILTWWAGALVNRQYAKSVLMLVLFVVLALIPVFGWIVLAVLYVLGIMDTIGVAARLYKGDPVDDFKFFY